MKKFTLKTLAMAVALTATGSVLAQTESGRLTGSIMDGWSQHTGKKAGMLLTDTQRTNLGDYVAEYNKPNPSDAGRRAISFGVDINESANGTEKAASQAVTVECAWLEVTHGSVTKYYGGVHPNSISPECKNITFEPNSGFYTETQAFVSMYVEDKKAKTFTKTPRVKMYTLLGRTGSAQITGGSDIQKAYDSTLKIEIPNGAVLSGATQAVLKVRLAPLDPGVGDPEAFYDYTAGFEDVALLNESDSNEVDKITSARDGAPGLVLSPEGLNTQAFNSAPKPVALSWVPKPSAGNYQIVAYEDLYPKQGDYDFNDLVVAYSYSLGVNGDGKVEKMTGQAYILARGSAYTHDWTLSINLPSADLSSTECETWGYKRFAAGTTTSRAIEQDTNGCSVSVSGGTLNWSAFKDSVKLFPANLAANRVAAQPFFTDNWFVPATDTTPAVQEPKATFSVTFKTPLPLSAFDNEDPWMQITRPDGYKPKRVTLDLRDSNNFPFAMKMPIGWQWPVERVPMNQAYPDFLNFVKSSGATNTEWHKTPNVEKINVRPQNTWAW